MPYVSNPRRSVVDGALEADDLPQSFEGGIQRDLPSGPNVVALPCCGAGGGRHGQPVCLACVVHIPKVTALLPIPVKSWRFPTKPFVNELPHPPWIRGDVVLR